MQISVCVCSDVNDLMEELVFPHHPEECRLFIDVTNVRLRAVLLENGSLKPSNAGCFFSGQVRCVWKYDTVTKFNRIRKRFWQIRGIVGLWDF